MSVVEDKFWTLISRSDSCWLWTGPLTNTGRGRLRVKCKGKEECQTAERFCYELLIGKIPDKAEVRQSCKNKLCVYPGHLFLANKNGGPWSLEDRFWNFVKKDSGCWAWSGTLDSYGYGVLSFKRKMLKAHRISYEIHNKVIDEELLVCHKCDNPSCVNPEHLFQGTSKDNTWDMIAKGRSGCIGFKKCTST